MSIKKNNTYFQEDNGKVYYYDENGERKNVPNSAFGTLKADLESTSGELIDTIETTSGILHGEIDTASGNLQEQINNIGSPLTYSGISSVAEINAITSTKQGTVYTVSDSGTITGLNSDIQVNQSDEIAYAENQGWVKIGKDFLYEDYYKKTETSGKQEIADALNTKEDKVFVAEYNVTPYADIKDAYDAGKQIVCKYVENEAQTKFMPLSQYVEPANIFIFVGWSTNGQSIYVHFSLNGDGIHTDYQVISEMFYNTSETSGSQQLAVAFNTKQDTDTLMDNVKISTNTNNIVIGKTNGEISNIHINSMQLDGVTVIDEDIEQESFPYKWNAAGRTGGVINENTIKITFKNDLTYYTTLTITMDADIPNQGIYPKEIDLKTVSVDDIIATWYGYTQIVVKEIGSNYITIGQSTSGPSQFIYKIYTTPNSVKSYIISTNEQGCVSHSAAFVLGNKCSAIAPYSFAFGNEALANATRAFAVGDGVSACGWAAHAEGKDTLAGGRYGDYTHAEGVSTSAVYYNSHAEGDHSLASGYASHVEGGYQEVNDRYYNSAYGAASHAEGAGTLANGNFSHVEGFSTEAKGDASHAGGISSYSNNSASFAHGYVVSAIGDLGSFAEGCATIASGMYSHAEGCQTEAKGNGSHAEGNRTTAIGEYSHSEGNQNEAYGTQAHSEGNATYASGSYSHAEGVATSAIGTNSHSEGCGTIAGSESMHAGGKYNKTSANALFVIGNGTDNEHRSDAFIVGSNGYVSATRFIESQPDTSLQELITFLHNKPATGSKYIIGIDEQGTLTWVPVTV